VLTPTRHRYVPASRYIANGLLVLEPLGALRLAGRHKSHLASRPQAAPLDRCGTARAGSRPVPEVPRRRRLTTDCRARVKRNHLARRIERILGLHRYAHMVPRTRSCCTEFLAKRSGGRNENSVFSTAHCPLRCPPPPNRSRNGLANAMLRLHADELLVRQLDRGQSPAQQEPFCPSRMSQGTALVGPPFNSHPGW
jgi:hypothetical protein